MFKARVPFCSGSTMYLPGREVPEDHPKLAAWLQKELVEEIKVIVPEKKKHGRPRKAKQAEQQDN